MSKEQEDKIEELESTILALEDDCSDLLEAIKTFIEAKTNAENDDCYNLNQGIHQQAIDKATKKCKQAITKAEVKD